MKNEKGTQKDAHSEETKCQFSGSVLSCLFLMIISKESNEYHYKDILTRTPCECQEKMRKTCEGDAGHNLKEIFLMKNY